MFAHVVDGSFVPMAHMDDFILAGVEVHLPRLHSFHRCVEVLLTIAVMLVSSANLSTVDVTFSSRSLI